MQFLNGEYWYNLFYLLAFATAFIVILREGYTRKFPFIEWLISILAITICFVIGTKIVTFSLEDWRFMFYEGQLISTESKSVLGGFIAGIVAILLLKQCYRFGWSIFDNYALAIPLGLAIQRLGCFMYGCCYGTITKLPLAVQYPINTLPHFHHYSNQLLGVNEILSQGVHPVQLYHSALLIISFVIIFRAKKIIRHAGNLFLLSWVLIGISRFIVEFFRAPLAHTFGGVYYGVLNGSQWGMLILVSLALLSFYLNARKEKACRSVVILSSGINKSIILFLMVTLVFITLKNWFGDIEQTVILFILFPIGGVLGWKVLIQSSSIRKKWISIGLVLVPITLLAQNAVKQINNDSTQVYHIVGLGYMQGSKKNSVDLGRGSGCDRVSNTEYFNHEYYLESVQYKKVTVNPSKRNRTYQQYDFFGGEHLETSVTGNDRTRNLIWGGSANFVYEGHIVGIGGGLIIGNLTSVHNDKEEEGYGFPEKGHFKTPLFPRAYFRIGREDIIFGEINVANDFPNSLISSPYRIGIGTGFGDKDGFKLRTGFMDVPKQEYDFSLYALLEVPVRDHFIIHSTFVTHKALDSYNFYSPKRTYQLGFGINYKFGANSEKPSLGAKF